MDIALTAAATAQHAVSQAVDSARQSTQAVTARVEHSVVRAQEYVKKNPLAIVLGAVTFGVAIGCAIALARRDPPSLRERFADDPMQATRDTLYAALAPVARHLHDGYDSARDGASKVMNGLHRTNHSWAHQLSRAGSHLKFW